MSSPSILPSQAVGVILAQARDVVRQAEADAPPLPPSAAPSRYRPVPQQRRLTWQPAYMFGTGPGFLYAADGSSFSGSVKAAISDMNEASKACLLAVHRSIEALNDYLRELVDQRVSAESSFGSAKMREYAIAVTDQPWKGRLAEITRVTDLAAAHFVRVDALYIENRSSLRVSKQ